MNSFGGAAVATGFLAANNKLLRPDCTDGELRTNVAVNRMRSNAFVLRPLEAARTTTKVDYKLGVDVNRLRTDVFVLRILRCLTFELSGRRRQDARPGLAKMYCVPPDRAWWPAVGAPLERGVRPQCAA